MNQKKYLLLPKTATIELHLKYRDIPTTVASLPCSGEDDFECFEEIRNLSFVDMIDESSYTGVSITVLTDHPRKMQVNDVIKMQDIIIGIIAKHEDRIAKLKASNLDLVQRESYDG